MRAAATSANTRSTVYQLCRADRQVCGDAATPVLTAAAIAFSILAPPLIMWAIQAYLFRE
jgi:hypothetical protein